MASNDVKYGAFLPTTFGVDVGTILNLESNSADFKTLVVQLYQIVNDIALMTNIKDTGYYILTEFVNGQTFFPNEALSSTTPQSPRPRQVFRKVVNFGALPNAASKTAAHGITIDSNLTFTRIYATASDPTGNSYLPIPYASATANNIIELSVDATDITITTGIDRTAYTTTYVVLEYLKQ